MQTPRAIRKLRRRLRTAVATRKQRRHALVGPLALWRQKRDFQIAFLRDQGLEPRHTLCDLGCGTLRGGIPIIEHLEVGHYTGIDVRPEVIEEARRELAEHRLEHKRPELVAAADLTQVHLGRRFDVIWAFAVLIHMSDEVLAGALAFVAEHLAPDGRFFANVNLGERPSARWRGFPVVWRPLAFYQARAAAAGLEVTDLGEVRDFGHVTGDERGDTKHMLVFRHARSPVGPAGTEEARDAPAGVSGPGPAPGGRG